jgi:hypothetical protein
VDEWKPLIAGCFGALLMPRGVGCYILGCTSLELGSLAYNMASLLGKDSSKDLPEVVRHNVEVFFQVGMFVSNVIALVGRCRLTLSNPC